MAKQKVEIDVHNSRNYGKAAGTSHGNKMNKTSENLMKI